MIWNSRKEMYMDICLGMTVLTMLTLQITSYLCDPSNVRLIGLGFTLVSCALFVYFIWKKHQFENFLKKWFPIIKNGDCPKCNQK